MPSSGVLTKAGRETNVPVSRCPFSPNPAYVFWRWVGLTFDDVLHSKLYCTIAAYCMMDGSAFFTSCWVLSVCGGFCMLPSLAQNPRSAPSCVFLVPSMRSSDSPPWPPWQIVDRQYVALEIQVLGRRSTKLPESPLAMKFQSGTSSMMWLMFFFLHLVRLPLQEPCQYCGDCAIQGHGGHGGWCKSAHHSMFNSTRRLKTAVVR